MCDFGAKGRKMCFLTVSLARGYEGEKCDLAGCPRRGDYYLGATEIYPRKTE